YRDENTTSRSTGDSLLYRVEFWPVAADWQPLGEGLAVAQSGLPRQSRCLGMVDPAAGHRRQCYCGCGIRRSDTPLVTLDSHLQRDARKKIQPTPGGLGGLNYYLK